jgi:hypothetical protein
MLGSSSDRVYFIGEVRGGLAGSCFQSIEMRRGSPKLHQGMAILSDLREIQGGTGGKIGAKRQRGPIGGEDDAFEGIADENRVRTGNRVDEVAARY